MAVIGWIIGIGILLVILFAVLIGVIFYFWVLARRRVTALIVYDDGSTMKKKFSRAPASFNVGKDRYVYDERASFWSGNNKTVLYRRGVPEPISVHTFKNPRVMSSGEFDAIIRAEVHKQLFGASNIETVKMLAIITLVGVGITVLILGYLAVTLGGDPEPVNLALTPENTDLIVSAVREAIGR